MASNTANATTASTGTFTAALVFNIAVFGIEIGLFTIVRPYFPAIYQPRTYVPPEDKRAQPMPRGILLWPIALFRADYTKIKEVNGLDAYLYVHFLRMIIRMFLPIWLISWIILLPVNSVQGNIPPQTPPLPPKTGLDRLSFGNIAPTKQGRYAAHLILAWLFTLWVWYIVRLEMQHFIAERHRWLISPEYSRSAQASTVLIRGVPQRYLTEQALVKLYEPLPGGVAKVWINRDLKDMPGLYERRMAACATLESAETALLKTATMLKIKKGETGPLSGDDKPLSDSSVADTERNLSLAEQLVPKAKRPIHRLPIGILPFSLPFIGKKVDSIEWAREEIVGTSIALKERRRILARDIAASSTEHDDAGLPPPETDDLGVLKPGPEARKQTYPTLNSAFILFNRQIAAHLAAQALTHHAPYRIADRELNIDPADVIWDNLGLNPYEARIRTFISWSITAGLIVFWALPVAFVGAVSNIHSLASQYAWLHWLNHLDPEVIGIISGILPPVLLALLMMVLPIVLRVLSRLEGKPTKTAIELSLMTRYFLFQVIHSFLIVTLSSGIIAALPTLFSNIGTAPKELAEQLPKASNFFLAYVVLQGLSGTASGFLQIPALVIYYIQPYLLGRTPRSLYSIKYTLPSVQWGTLWPMTTLLVVISLTYSVISPIINGLTCAAFFLFYQLWKYQFLWQIGQPKSSETGGLFFPLAIQHIFVGMYIQQVCLAALFFLARDENNHPSALAEGGLMVVLIVFTIWFHMVLNASYGPLIHSLPLSLADQLGGFDVNRARAEKELRASETSSTTDEKKSIRDVEVVAELTSKEEARRDSVGGSKNKGKSPEVLDASGFEVVENPRKSAPPSIKSINEDEGPKEFYHPATMRPQWVVWIPKDELGLAEEEERATRDAGIEVSTEGASMDERGRVTISGPPPGGEIREL